MGFFAARPLFPEEAMTDALKKKVLNSIQSDSYTLHNFFETLRDTNLADQPDFPENAAEALSRSLFWDLPFSFFLMNTTAERLRNAYGFRRARGKRVRQIEALLSHFSLKLGMTRNDIDWAVFNLSLGRK
jgi:hypothetical protein